MMMVVVTPYPKPVDLYVQEDGNLKVKETLHYSFSGTYRGFIVPLILRREKIRNLNVSTKGAYSNYQVTPYDGQTKITVYLYSNERKTIPHNQQDVVVTYEYDFINVTRIYTDIAALHYKVCGVKNGM